MACNITANVTFVDIFHVFSVYCEKSTQSQLAKQVIFPTLIFKINYLHLKYL